MSERQRTRFGGWVRKLGPWAVAAAILAFLFQEIPVAAAWEAGQTARLEWFAAGMLTAVTIWFLIESVAYSYLFTRFNVPLSWAEARSLRGVTYLLTPINWNAGTAGVILHLRRSKDVSAVDSGSSMLFYGLIDGVVLTSFLLIGAALLPESPEIATLRRIALGVVCGQLGFIALLMLRVPGWSWLARLRRLAIFRTFREARARDLAWLTLLRCAYFACFVGVFWLGSSTFDIRVPLLVATAATPAILAAGALPITPAGLGTQQAAMLYFFGAYGEPAAILAFGLCFPIALNLGRCLLGLGYLRDLRAIRAA
jgi:uncharacterized membrane protein YbhN (UPF0104 family)